MRRFARFAYLIVFMGISAASAEAADAMRTISVAGYAETRLEPDRASATAGVVAQAATAVEAMTQNAEAMTAVFSALERVGISSEDVQTSNLNVSPVFDEVRNSRAAPRIVAYRVSNSVSVLVREPARLGEILDALIKGGANSLNGVRFFVARDEALQDSLRIDAIQDARRKAALMAEAAGAALGPVVSIQEAGGIVRPVAMARMQAESLSAMPVVAGTETVSTSVAVVFELLPQ